MSRVRQGIVQFEATPSPAPAFNFWGPAENYYGRGGLAGYKIKTRCDFLG